MSGAMRLPEGGDIDRGTRLAFTFDGRPVWGFSGDSIASALIANGVRIVGRSFKYHRPRGIFALGAEEPNAIVDLRHGGRHDPNARATIELLHDGMAIRSIHARGTAAHDRLAVMDRLHRFIPAAFYYKTFFWPGWMFHEGRIRALAGLGRLDPGVRTGLGRQCFASVDLCVIGAGPAGLAAARDGVARGERVLIADEQIEPGGSALIRHYDVDGRPGRAWTVEARRDLKRLGATVLTRATGIALYDHNTVAIVERSLAGSAAWNGERLWGVRAKRIVLATGAIERPLLFAGNDRPGVMLAGAVLGYLRRQAVRAGGTIVVATNNDSAYETALALKQAGAAVTLVDSRAAPPLLHEAQAAGIDLRIGARVAAALGRQEVEGVEISTGERIAADTLAVSGGWSPAIHLYAHAGGVPRWHDRLGAYVPGEPLPGITVVGAAYRIPDAYAGAPELPQDAGKGRVWVDLQNDVTVKDIQLAVRESFKAAEHLKRYTTLGMASDQGKTSGVNGLAVLAATTGRAMADLGPTTFRPPYVPVAFSTLAGVERGELLAPVRRLPAENVHRAEGAVFREYGCILRPAWYASGDQAIAGEGLVARSSVTIFDASPLGKIEVIGPDAAAFLDFIFYTRMSTLAPGRLRYGLLLTEGGVIFDDGVVLRLTGDHFVVSCSSSHVKAVVGHFEEWRQDRYDMRRVLIQDATPHWATMTVAGRIWCRKVIEKLSPGAALDDASLPHMAMVEGCFRGAPARISRVSFTGERSYEISVPAGQAAALWSEARSHGANPIGVEALSLLRAEKGFIIVGADTDGETMPHDIGMGGPREKRQDAYVGDRSLFTPAAMDAHRKQLVGIAAVGAAALPVGAHAVTGSGMARRSLGYVTSSYWSKALNRPVALGLIQNGRARLGDELSFHHLGSVHAGRIVPPCFLDPEGARLHA